MPSNNSKYTQELRERTAEHIIDSGKSATSIAEEMGIDTNTVCRWVRDYRRKNYMPSYDKSKGIRKVTDSREKEVNKQIKERDKRIRNLEEEVDILKNPCASLCNHCNDKEYCVQTWAAAHCLSLGIHQKKSISMLEQISEMSSKDAPSFEAKMILIVWKEKGILAF